MQSPFDQGNAEQFSWELLGNIGEGRQNLGESMPVIVYRLFEYTMRSVLIEKYGKDGYKDVFTKAGFLAGGEFAKHMVDLTLPLDEFIASLQNEMRVLNIGILRIESFDEKTGRAVLTVSEDLDCSGLPMVGETVCTYDEGFIAGILSEYTGKGYIATEIDCWAKGDRVCRFVAEIK